MPRYTLSQPTYINERLYAAGESVDTDITPGPHMEPAKDDRGREDKDARKAKDDAAAAAKLPAPGDPGYIGAMIEHALTNGATNGRIASSSAPLPTLAQSMKIVEPPIDPTPSV